MDLLELTSNTSDEFYNEIMRNCLDNRVLVFNRSVDESLIEDMILYILKWNRDDKDVPKEKRKPITILIHSPGGEVFSGNAFVNVLLASETPTRAVGIGIVASAAFDIFLACDERICWSRSIFLIHDGALDISTSSKKMRDVVTFFTESMVQKDKDFILSRTNMDEDFYNDIYGEEFYFYADKAKEYGVVHKIIGEDCDLSYIL